MDGRGGELKGVKGAKETKGGKGTIGIFIDFILFSNNGVVLDIGNIEWFCGNNSQTGLTLFWNGREETNIGKGRFPMVEFERGFEMEGMVMFVENGKDWCPWLWIILSDCLAFEELIWLIPKKRGFDFGLKFGFENKGPFINCEFGFSIFSSYSVSLIFFFGCPSSLFFIIFLGLFVECTSSSSSSVCSDNNGNWLKFNVFCG